MAIDPKKIAEWKALSDAYTRYRSAPDFPTFSVAETNAVEDFRGACREMVPALLSERKEMLAVLRSVEWGQVQYGYPRDCLFCHASSDVGEHAPDCRLAALLRGAP